jgi:hypothetical protein
MSNQLFKLRQDCRHASDDYYRAVALWLRATPRPNEPCDKCLSLVITYNAALENLLTRLRTFKSTKRLTDEIARTMCYQKMLAGEIKRGYQL